ncbi:Rpn family recombination-promoting nuclease/putative transposase [Romeriopsis navalis]|uniref:Rpn family recombination-promoting nuclease/putative transposase n=1 Tax=Romeriopsis navalis TaxID=2992132 RepID=UPI0021F84F0A|nr:Rpn family recombination-promoting nuclease/putative transposase [Romeriopsis navalis]
MRRDSIFYKIFQRSPLLLFELLPESPANAADYWFDSVEVKETGCRIDEVFFATGCVGCGLSGESIVSRCGISATKKAAS